MSVDPVDHTRWSDVVRHRGDGGTFVVVRHTRMGAKTRYTIFEEHPERAGHRRAASDVQAYKDEREACGHALLASMGWQWLPWCRYAWADGGKRPDVKGEPLRPEWQRKEKEKSSTVET